MWILYFAVTVKTLMKACCFLAAWLALTPILVNVQAAEPSLDSLKHTYETEVQKIRSDHDATVRKLLNAYGQALEQTIDVLKQQGDPDPVLKAAAEKDRFERDRTVPKPPGAALPQIVQDLQVKYHDAELRAEVEKGQSFVALTERYVAALDRLMRQYTTKNKLDLALNVKEEKKRTEFVLADVEQQLAKVASDPQSTRQSAGGEVVEAHSRVVQRASGPPVPSDAVEWNGHHYKILPEIPRWHDAKRKCEQLGGHLVTISSSAELTFVRRLAQGQGGIWLGATDEKREGTWRWLDGTVVSGLKWCKSEPSDGRTNWDEDFLVIWLKKAVISDEGRPLQNVGAVCEWDY